MKYLGTSVLVLCLATLVACGSNGKKVSANPPVPTAGLAPYTPEVLKTQTPTADVPAPAAFKKDSPVNLGANSSGLAL